MLHLPPLIMGGAGWSYQLVEQPEASPVLDIVKAAFARGVRAIDTSPYYEPSEELLGAALSHPDIKERYARSDYLIMTKCGRIAADHFDYSPEWIEKSVQRSLQRFNTDYLDVVFCHDVEFVTLETAVEAVGTLFKLSDRGLVKYAGISGYDLDAIVRVANEVRRRFGRPVDVVQNWAQLSLQNSRLETYGLPALKNAGVKAVCNASPLACGLLREGGVPVGRLGDWHPAPAGLRAAARQASAWVTKQNNSLASVSLQFAIIRAMTSTTADFSVSTITGISTMADLDENIAAAAGVLQASEQDKQRLNSSDTLPSTHEQLNTDAVENNRHFGEGVRRILGEWIDFDLMQPTAPSPPSSETKDRDPLVSVEEVSSRL